MPLNETRIVTAASKLLEIPRASLSTFLNASDRNDLWVETPRGRKVFTRERLERISEAMLGDLKETIETQAETRRSSY